MTTIVLADDHALIREGLRAVLDSEPGYAVVGETADGLAAVDLVARLQPDVLIVDLMLPGLSGLEVIHQVRRRVPQTHIVALSMYANESYVLAALRNGAAGYVLKDAGSTEIIQAVREVVAGRRYLSPPLSQYALEVYIQKAKGLPLDSYETLTPREREVLHLAAQSYTTAAIAARLALSPRTVETHRANLMRKLGLRTQTDLIRYALQHGIIYRIDHPHTRPCPYSNPIRIAHMLFQPRTNARAFVLGCSSMPFCCVDLRGLRTDSFCNLAVVLGLNSVDPRIATADHTAYTDSIYSSISQMAGDSYMSTKNVLMKVIASEQRYRHKQSGEAWSEPYSEYISRWTIPMTCSLMTSAPLISCLGTS